MIEQRFTCDHCGVVMRHPEADPYFKRICLEEGMGYGKKSLPRRIDLCSGCLDAALAFTRRLTKEPQP